MSEVKTQKIGEVNYDKSENEKFKTEFSLTPKVKEYLEKLDIALASLLPGGWEWYEVELFDVIDEDGDGNPEEKYGKEFEVIYFGIVEDGNEAIEDEIEKETDKKVFEGQAGFDGSPKNQDKKFRIKYIVKMKE